MAGSTDQTTRRAVIGGAAVVGAGAVLAACGGGGSGATAGGVGAGGDAKTPKGPIAETSDIPVRGGKIFDDAKVVVTQRAKGDFKAFSAVCTHSGCIVAAVVDDTIECHCHGSRYSAEDGSVTRGPAPAPLAAKKLTVQGDEIVLG